LSEFPTTTRRLIVFEIVKVLDVFWLGDHSDFTAAFDSDAQALREAAENAAFDTAKALYERSEWIGLNHGEVWGEYPTLSHSVPVKSD
jgi:hypothetical protein